MAILSRYVILGTAQQPLKMGDIPSQLRYLGLVRIAHETGIAHCFSSPLSPAAGADSGAKNGRAAMRWLIRLWIGVDDHPRTSSQMIALISANSFSRSVMAGSFEGGVQFIDSTNRRLLVFVCVVTPAFAFDVFLSRLFDHLQLPLRPLAVVELLLQGGELGHDGI
jgi:hypothetical protein